MVKVELLRTAMTYIIALVVILGGGYLMVVPSQVPSEQLLPFLTGAIGVVLAFVFAERQQAASNATAVTVAKATNGQGNIERDAAITAIHKRLDALGAPPAADVPVEGG